MGISYKLYKCFLLLHVAPSIASKCRTHSRAIVRTWPSTDALVAGEEVVLGLLDDGPHEVKPIGHPQASINFRCARSSFSSAADAAWSRAAVSIWMNRRFNR